MKIAVTSHHVRLAALVLVLGLATAMSARSRAEPPANKEANKERVVPTQRDFKLRNAEAGAERPAKIAVYRVEQVKGGSLLLAAGWRAGRLGQRRAGRAGRAGRRVLQRSDRQVATRPPQLRDARHGSALGAGRPRARHADCESAIRLDPNLPSPEESVKAPVRAATQVSTRPSPGPGKVIRLTTREPDAYSDRGARLSSGLRQVDADFNEAIRLDPQDSATFVFRTPRVAAIQKARQGHGRLQRGHPPRPEERRCLSPTGFVSGPKRRIRPGHRRLHPAHQARFGFCVRGARNGLAAQERL